ncbi:GNAT family N-acetyltransferase [Alteromonas halophila]|uniref:tRNA(Met) cytidine acetyltransferase TmcA n=1 Tax=Alteromonas halophila TaxID=516698 RepID=A0A918JCR7_9ALTE|nr:GNAT family N-acetyltransferase [Alteromonas halophila]GGW74104.1 tRNA(Met) cytidine acetyltransferase TmcA [Alteromonas halophila]
MAVVSINKWLLAGQNPGRTPVHRQLLHVSGPQSQCYMKAHALLHALPPHIKTCWAGPGEHPAGRQTYIRHATQLLGQEFDIAVYDAHQPFRPSALMALAGTVKKGGRLLLLTPPHKRWHQSPEVLATHFLTYGYTLTESPYLKRLTRNLSDADESSGVACWHDAHAVLPVCNATPADDSVPAPFATLDQANTFNAIQSALQSSNTAIVITAPRGRGKSTLLGLLAADLLKRGCDIALTSPVTYNTATLIETVRQHTSVHSGSPNAVQISINSKTRSLSWYAPDNPALTQQRHRYLIVDEAASLPLPVIKQLAMQADTLILATTTHGYEGSGQGFFHRFLPWLAAQKCLTQHQLHAPIRWYQGDPLEKFCQQALLLCEPSARDAENCTARGVTWSVTQFSSMCEAQLQQTVQLLSNAHYQTSPDDIMRLIDAPDSFVIVGMKDSLVVAVCVINREGGDPLQGLASEISAGRRRVKGHLGAQRLALITASEALATQCYWRINRIAVRPDYQSMGIGSQCLAFVFDYAKDRYVDALLSSFGASDTLIAFWQRNQFAVVHRGVKMDKASGASSALVVRPLSSVIKSELPMLTQLYDFDTGIRPVTDLYEPADQTTAQCHSIMIKRLSQFAGASRSFDQLGAAWRYFTTNSTVSRYRQLHSLTSIGGVASALGLAGKKAAQQELRQAISRYLKDVST